MDNLDFPDIAFTRVAFFGPMASGKTFLAKHLVDDYGFTKLAFADKLKQVAKELFHVEGKDGKAREIYQQLGEGLRRIDDNVWVNAILDKIDTLATLYGEDVPIVIDDVRYKNELTALRAKGFVLIKVTTSEIIRLQRVFSLYPNTTRQALNHVSETDLLHDKGDHSVDSRDYKAIHDLDGIISGTITNSLHRAVTKG
jgi:dephospho-CoA kinase